MGDGVLSVQDLDRHLYNVEVEAILSSLEISSSDIRTLFTLLDADKEDLIDSDDLVSGVMRLKGTAKRSDFVELRQLSKTMFLAILDITDQIEAMGQNVSGLLSTRYSASLS